ncbi:MAG: hypothetical protein WBE11_14055 [Candidatus Aminicenantaceae bacterium]
MEKKSDEVFHKSNIQDKIYFSPSFGLSSMPSFKNNSETLLNQDEVFLTGMVNT